MRAAGTLFFHPCPGPAFRLGARWPVIAALALAFSCFRACGQDWPAYRGASGDGTVAEEKLLADWPAGGLRLLWRAQLGPGGGGTYGGAVIAGDRVFVPGREEASDYWYCLEMETGRRLWAQGQPAFAAVANRGAGARATPSVSAGRLYALNRLGLLLCLDASSGRPCWRRHCAEFSGRSPAWGFAAAPLVEGERVILAIGSGRAAVVAFEATGGLEIWRAGKADDLPAYVAPMVALLAGTRQVLVLLGRRLVSLDPATGLELWEHRLEPLEGNRASASSPLVRGDRVYFASPREGCVALKVSKAGTEWRVEREWRNPAARVDFCSPVADGERLYLQDGQGRLCAFKLQDGRLLWSLEGIGRKHAGLLFLPPDHILALTDGGEVLLIEVGASGGREKGRFRALERGAFAPPAVAGGRLFVRDNRALLCYDLSSARTGGGSSAGPVVEWEERIGREGHEATAAGQRGPDATRTAHQGAGRLP